MTPEEEKRFPRLSGLQVLKGILHPILFFIQPAHYLISDKHEDHSRKGDDEPGSENAQMVG
jgi:hypothetical protein